MSNENAMTEHELQQIEARVEAASRGPWKSWIEGRDHTAGSSFIATAEPGDAPNAAIELSGATEADQDFIAHAREDVPRLLAEVVRLRRLLEEAERGRR